jgi:uncharacterized protein (DUF2267 family)
MLALMLEECADRLIAELRNDGLEEEAQTIHTMVHRMAWTTSSEFIGELRSALQKIRKKQRGRLSQNSRKAMDEVFAIIGKPLPFFRL